MSGRSSFVVLVPSEFIRKSCGYPSRSLTNAMVCPVFGFHVGEILAPFAIVKRFGRPPLMSETKSSGFPSIEEEKRICVPSGDHAGVLFVPRNRGKETCFPVSSEYMQICALVTPP